MRIMVFAVPAERGGALTILNQYHNFALNDITNEWIFVLSMPQLKECEHVKVLNFPWIKKSWIHRLYFDVFVAGKLVKKYNANEILSLQNVVVPKTNVKQTLYLHQPLPFVEKRYGFTENFRFWVYQNIISRMIIKSIREADKVIVQTKWIMDAAIKKANVKKEKFIIRQPELNVTVKKFYEPDEINDKVFFYPSNSLIYKNHEIIVKACSLLKDKGISNYKIIFTINADENKHIRKLKQLVIKEKLPIKFLGSIDIDSVYEYYSKSILIFPSYIETFGLPLLEAKLHRAPIIASDLPFSHEILDGYLNAYFFDFTSPKKLADVMATFLNHN